MTGQAKLIGIERQTPDPKRDPRFEPLSGARGTFGESFFPSQKMCADSLSCTHETGRLFGAPWHAGTSTGTWSCNPAHSTLIGTFLGIACRSGPVRNWASEVIGL